MRLHRLAAFAVAAVLIAGCGDDGDQRATTQTVERTTTRVEVLESDSAAKGGAAFDPRAIYERQGPGVVTVLSLGLRGLVRGDGGLGSGFVLNADGEIVTNAHVVTSGEGGDIRRARDVYIRFASGDQVEARLIGYDPFSDVALLKVDPEGLTLRPLQLGSIRDVEVGQPVAAIGSPFGEEQSLSVGVVSATDRSINSLTGFETQGAIQTDAAINSGNSGGPLLNARGQVLGINSQIRTRSGEGSGVGFAVPVDIVRRSIKQLRRNGRARYAYLGVSTRGIYPQLAERFDLPVDNGAWVQQVVDDGPAEKAGVRAGGKTGRFQEQAWRVGGDIIVAVAGHEVHRDTDLGRFLVRFEPGEEIEIEIIRKGDRKRVKVTLGERPVEAPRG